MTCVSERREADNNDGLQIQSEITTATTTTRRKKRLIVDDKMRCNKMQWKEECLRGIRRTILWDIFTSSSLRKKFYCLFMDDKNTQKASVSIPDNDCHESSAHSHVHDPPDSLDDHTTFYYREQS